MALSWSPHWRMLSCEVLIDDYKDGSQGRHFTLNLGPCSKGLLPVHVLPPTVLHLKRLILRHDATALNEGATSGKSFVNSTTLADQGQKECYHVFSFSKTMRMEGLERPAKSEVDVLYVTESMPRRLTDYWKPVVAYLPS